MDLDAKLSILMSLAADDREGLPPRLRNQHAAGALRPVNIRQVRMGANGPKRGLLRILMTNACSYNCHYCPMRRDRELPRTLLKPEEIVRIFLDAVARGWASGLFITTGIPGRPVGVMDKLIAVLEMLREHHGYRGYIHVKIIPGADTAQIDRITALANRVSINLETPCGETLSAIAPEKVFDTTLVTLQRAQRQTAETQAEERHGRPRSELLPGGNAGMTTQFVVGATNDTDRSLISRATDLYKNGGVHHTHFAAFRPISDTPMAGMRAASAIREHRLYEADHLLRRYGFAPEEIIYDGSGNLPLAHDPKLAWALSQGDRFPLDVGHASYHELLRVPGIGPIAAQRIIETRRASLPRGTGDLRKLGVVMTRAAGFLLLRGKRLAAERWQEQLGFWEAGDDAGVPNTIYSFSPGTFR